MEFKYHYYVTYLSDTKGWGSVCIHRTIKIRTFKDIQNVADYISRELCENGKVIVFNFIEIEGESEK